MDLVSEEQAQKDLLAAFIGEGGRHEDVDDEEKPYVDPEGLTVEQRVRKERPPSRIRFAESSQPDYVMMALEGVGLMYGNQVTTSKIIQLARFVPGLLMPLFDLFIPFAR